MKLQSLVRPALAFLAVTLAALTAHAHDNKKKVAGPNGGRILTAVEPRAEFFVRSDRKVQITFLGPDGKAVAPAAQVVIVTAGERAAPTTLTFAPSGNMLVSDRALPAGNAFPAVVQLKATPNAKTVYEKFNVDLSKCPECKLGEYACICAH